MMWKIFMLSLLVVSSCSYRPDPMRKADWVRYSISTGLMVVDWRQTVEITKREDEGYWERNPILGDHPTEREVNQYFLASLGLKSVTTYLLPYGWRDIFQYGTIGLSAVCVGNNLSIGLNGEW